MTHLSPTMNPNAARVDDDDDHTIVIPPEDRCLVVLPEPLLGHEAEITAILEGQLSPPARKPRKPTLASVAKQAKRAAIAVVRYEVKPDCTIVVVTGEPEPAKPENPWLAELPKETKQ